MGSSGSRIGNLGGMTAPGFTFTAPGQSAVWGWGTFHSIIPVGMKDYVFQLCGTGTGLAVTMYGTVDIATAAQEPGNGQEWFQLVAPSPEAGGAQWSNPLYPLSSGGQSNILYCSVPLLAFKAVSSNQVGSPPVTGSVYLQWMIAG